MDSRPRYGIAAILLVIASCAVVEPGPIDPQAVQPVAHFHSVRPPPPEGLLRVITETYEVVYGDDRPYWLHEGYDVFRADGAFVQHVENHVSNTDEGVMTIRLPPGAYLIAIPDSRRPRQWIEVTIEVGCLTEADVSSLRRS